MAVTFVSTGPKDRKLFRKVGAAPSPDEASDEAAEEAADEEAAEDASDEEAADEEADDEVPAVEEVADDEVADDVSPSSPQDANAQAAVSSSAKVSNNAKVLFMVKALSFLFFFHYTPVRRICQVLVAAFARSRRTIATRIDVVLQHSVSAPG